eukprot:TRINITY_DN3497_c0_g1_i3.p1 TRINITY_DN3497_c0_g1~~TRINITY_DN3497_c0_g1_i3.p1  ORF type:complete len:150 (-),score=29.03 TRINITY_DN3497_c0_g1_i3:83-532(-)
MITSRYWEDLVMAIIGGQFNVPDDELCGAVISCRNQFDMLSIWTKHATNLEYRNIISDTIKSVLKLPVAFRLEFKAHDDSIKDTKALNRLNKSQKGVPSPKKPASSQAPIDTKDKNDTEKLSGTDATQDQLLSKEDSSLLGRLSKRGKD